CADISERERRGILGDNAARVFGLPHAPQPLPSTTAPPNLIDVHAHVGTLGFPTPVVSDHAGAVAPHGIVRSIASSLRAIADDLNAGNAECFAATSSTLLPYVVLDPNDPDTSCTIMDDAYQHDRAVGAKIHCGWSHAATASRACADLVRQVARRHRPLLIHVDGPEWSAALGDIARDYPDWKVIVAHAGPGTPSREAAEL